MLFFVLFSLFITHLDQSPVSQLSPRPILIKSSIVNIILVQTTVYCTPFSISLFTSNTFTQSNFYVHFAAECGLNLDFLLN